MSEEIQAADANLHAERAALRTAAQTAGITLWMGGDTYHAAMAGTEATGATLGAALVALCARLGDREATTRADLDTLRNGVAWLGAELDRARRWGALWKRAATKYLIANWRLRGILRGERARREDAETALDSARAYADQTDAEYDDLRDRALGILRAARLLVGAWRQEQKNEATARSMGWELYGLLKDWQTCERMRDFQDEPCGTCDVCRALAFWKTMYGKDLVQPTAPTEPPTQAQGGEHV